MEIIISNEKGRLLKFNNMVTFNKFAFGECLANWEWHSKAYKEYCKQYGNDERTPSGELKYDRYIDRLAKAERKEFYENSIENMQKYCSKWKIVKIQQDKCECEMTA